jgi:hypothetical protein
MLLTIDRIKLFETHTAELCELTDSTLLIPKPVTGHDPEAIPSISHHLHILPSDPFLEVSSQKFFVLS